MTYPTIGKGSKIGFHQTEGGPALGYARDALARGIPFPLGKSVNHNGNVVQLKTDSPPTLRIARLTHPEWEAAPGMDDEPSDAHLRDMANQMADYIMSRTNAEERAATHWYEMWNEPRPHTVRGYTALARLMMFSADAAEARGFKIAAFAFNAGTPEWDEIRAMLQTGVMQRLIAGGHIWSAHEGLLPMAGFDDTTPILVGLGSPITNPYTGVTSPAFPDAGYLCLRYRFWLHAAQELGIPLAPFFISEFYPSVHRPLRDLPIEDVVGRYATYDAEIAKDSLCLGVTPFTLGGSGSWDHENHDKFYPGLLDYGVRVKDRVNGAPVPPPPPPPPTDRATHVVNATLLNVRLHPWSGAVVPPLVKQLPGGTRVRVEGMYKTPAMEYGWACLSPNGNEWVNSRYLTAL